MGATDPKSRPLDHRPPGGEGQAPPSSDEVAGDPIGPHEFEAGFDLFGDIQAKLTHARLRQSLFGEDPEPIRIGRYFAYRTLGSGGMGTVWEAFDPQLGRKVALKLLNDATMRIAGMDSRLQREAQALAQLSHPNVVTVYETGEHEGKTFIAMEFIDGPNLHKHCRGLARRRILEVYIAAARGLAAAHRAGIVHRDFKPANVLVDKVDHRVRVLDFGLARGADDQEPWPDASVAGASLSANMSMLGPITRSGQIVGTPQYMAPEQCAGEAADERCDQFSFCVALYEALYGERPFRGRTAAALREAALDGEVRPPAAGSKVPPWLRRVLLRGLSGDPASRYESMEALITALEADPRSRLLKWLSFLLGAPLVAGGAWVIYQRVDVAQQRAALQEERATQEQARRESAEQELHQSILDRTDALTMREVELVLPEDPTLAVAMLKNLSETADAWNGEARMIAADAAYAGIAREVTGLPEDSDPYALSPNGTYVVTRDSSTGATRLFDTRTRSWTELAAEGVAAPLGVFSPDGKHLVSIRTSGALGIWDVPGGAYRELGTVPEDHRIIAFSPDGNSVVAYGRHPEVHVWNVADGSHAVFGPHTEGVTTARFSPDGRFLATVDAYGTVRRFTLTDGAVRVVTGVAPIAFAPDGTLATALGPGDVLLFPADDSESDALEGLGTALQFLEISKDGTRVAGADERGGVIIWDMTTQRAHRLPGHAEEVTGLGLLHGGRFVVTTSIDNTLGIWDSESSHGQRLRGHRGVTFWAVDEADQQLVTVGFEGQIRRWDLPEETQGPSPGHEGHIRAIAHGPGVTFATGGQDGAVREWDGTDWSVVVEHDRPVTAVVYAGSQLASADDMGTIFLRWDGATPRRLPPAGGVAENLAFSPDGTKLAVAQLEAGIALFELPEGAVAELDTSPFTPKWLSLEPDPTKVTAVGWIPDGGFSVRIFAADGGEELARHELYGETVTAAAFARDGRHVAFATAVRAVDVWDSATLLSRHLGDHRGLIDGIDFAPDGRTIATASRDGTVRLWDALTERSRAIDLHQPRLNAISFAPNGDSFAAGGGDELVYVGRDDLPRDAAGLRAWLHEATSYEVKEGPIE